MSSESPVLSARGLNAGYGEVNVLWDVDLALRAGEITALIGSNGAGKTTLMRVLSGLLPSTAGQVCIGGRDLSGCTTAEFLASGVAHVPEGRRLFGAMTVEENLLMGAYARRDGARSIAQGLERVYAFFPRLHERRRQDAGTLSGGEQQMCAIGRGLMSAPRLLMIDELSLGLAPVMVEQLIESLRLLNREGLTLLVVEQDVVTALELSTQVYVMDQGRMVRAGRSADLLRDPAIKRAYLGELAA